MKRLPMLMAAGTGIAGLAVFMILAKHLAGILVIAAFGLAAGLLCWTVETVYDRTSAHQAAREAGKTRERRVPGSAFRVVDAEKPRL